MKFNGELTMPTGAMALNAQELMEAEGGKKATHSNIKRYGKSVKGRPGAGQGLKIFWDILGSIPK